MREQNDSEKKVAQINSNVFFKEFTFSSNDFKTSDKKQQLEFADNVVWLDDLFFAFQIKEQGINSTSGVINWFNKEVLNTAVRQIKNTIEYVSIYPEVFIENEKGHKLNIIKARECVLQRVIVYSPLQELPKEKRQMKFHISSKIGLIHLFHIDDYQLICKYLITPAEVNEYLKFRESLFLFDKKFSVTLSEEYFLCHFLETAKTDHFNQNYIENLSKYSIKKGEFDVTEFIQTFEKGILHCDHRLDYYKIIAEVAKLDRFELMEFKKRLSLSVKESRLAQAHMPYRVSYERTDCAFVFVPMHYDHLKYSLNALQNFNRAHKYESGTTKGIGFVISINPFQPNYINMVYEFAEHKWEFDEEIELMLKRSYPFRSAKIERIEKKYI